MNKISEHYDERQEGHFKKRLANNIKLIRRASGLTGDDFATKIGVSRTYLYKLETATAATLALDTILKLTYQVDNMDDLFNKDMTLTVGRVK